MSKSQTSNIVNVQIAAIKKILLNPIYHFDFNNLRDLEISLIRKYSKDVKEQLGNVMFNSLLRKSYTAFLHFEEIILNDLYDPRGDSEVLSDIKYEKISSQSFENIHQQIKPEIINFQKKYNVNRPFDPSELQLMIRMTSDDTVLDHAERWPSFSPKHLIHLCQLKHNHIFDSDFIDNDGYINVKIKMNSNYSNEVLLFFLEKIIKKYTDICYLRDHPKPSKLFLEKNPNYKYTQISDPPKIRFRDNILLALDVWEKWTQIFEGVLTPEKSFKKIAQELKISENTAKTRWYRAYIFLFEQNYSKNVIKNMLTPNGFCNTCEKKENCEALCHKAKLELNKVTHYMREIPKPNSTLDRFAKN